MRGSLVHDMCVGVEIRSEVYMRSSRSASNTRLECVCILKPEIFRVSLSARLLASPDQLSFQESISKF